MSKSKPIDLSDLQLFGNDAAELERHEVFQSYFVNRPEYSDFCSSETSFRIVMAFKGEGKSALLKHLATQISERSDNELLISKSGADIKPVIDSLEMDDWVRAWKRQIFFLLACEIGAQLSIAISDDATGLVELAENEGFRPRNWFRSILDRRAPKAKIGSGEVSAEVAVTRLGVSNPEQLLLRWKSRTPLIWLIIDDIDQNFENTRTDQLKVASFLTAIREVTSALPDVKIRASIRPNVWTILKLTFTAMSHVRQSLFEIKWDQASIRRLLAERVKAYCNRNHRDELLTHERLSGETREDATIRLAFESPVAWGNEMLPIHVALGTLALMRPRWMIQLCRAAGKVAASHKHPQIQYQDVMTVMKEHGRECVSDIVAEFSAQCKSVGELINTFRGGVAMHSTDSLVKHLTNKVVGHIDVEISGKNVSKDPVAMAHFLFQIGFLFACIDQPNRSVIYQNFSDNPDLLASKVNIDQGVRWEIQSVFRQALSIGSKAMSASNGSKKKR